MTSELPYFIDFDSEKNKNITTLFYNLVDKMLIKKGEIYKNQNENNIEEAKKLENELDELIIKFIKTMSNLKLSHNIKYYIK